MTTERTTRGTPPMAGSFDLRPWRGEADLPAIAAVLNASMAADGIDIVRNADEVRNFLEHAPNLDPSQDTFLAEVDGELVAYGDASWSDETAGARIYRADLYVLPAFRETSLPGSLFQSLVQHLLAVADGHPGVEPKLMSVSLGEAEVTLRTIVEGHGFEPTRTFYRMVRKDLEDIPDYPLPSGVEARTALPEHARTIYNAMKEAFQEHWGNRPGSEEEYQLWLNDPKADPDLWQVAWDGDEVAGMVLNFIDEDENRRYDRARGYTEDICVRLPWRRQGLAKALIARSLHLLSDLGMAEAALGVDADNQTGALDLYLAFGYETRWKTIAYRKPLTGHP
jgi:mycothiol synthase